MGVDLSSKQRPLRIFSFLTSSASRSQINTDFCTLTVSAAPSVRVASDRRMLCHLRALRNGTALLLQPRASSNCCTPSRGTIIPLPSDRHMLCPLCCLDGVVSCPASLPQTRGCSDSCTLHGRTAWPVSHDGHMLCDLFNLLIIIHHSTMHKMDACAKSSRMCHIRSAQYG